MNRTFISFSVGLVVLLVMLVAGDAYGSHFCSTNLHDVQTLVCYLGRWFDLIAPVLGGYCVGRMGDGSGIKAGFVLGIVGLIVSLVAARLFGAQFGSLGSWFYTLVNGLELFIVPSTLAGGVGELHRRFASSGAVRSDR